MREATTEVVIFGVGEMADILAAYLDADPRYTLAGFTLDRNWMTAERFLDRPVVPFDAVAETFPPARYRMMVAIGYTAVNGDRQRKHEEAKELGYTLASYIHPSTRIDARAEIGEHAVMFENNVVQKDTVIGDDVRIWANCYVTRDCTVGDHVYMSSGIVLAGGVRIGDNCFLGANAAVTPKVTIGPHSILGAGVTMTRDTEPETVWIAPRPQRLPVNALRWDPGAGERVDRPRYRFGLAPEEAGPDDAGGGT